MTGINGASGNVTGLIDTGADITQLPVGFASLMGYDASTLESIPDRHSRCRDPGTQGEEAVSRLCGRSAQRRYGLPARV